MVQYTLVYRQGQRWSVYTSIYTGVEMVQYTLVYRQGQRWSSIHQYIYMSSIHQFIDRGQRWFSTHQFIYRGRDGLLYTSIYTCLVYTSLMTGGRDGLVYTSLSKGVEVIQYTLVNIQGQRWSSIHKYIYRGNGGLVYTSIYTGQRWSSIHQYIYRGRGGLVHTSINAGVEMVQYTQVYLLG